MAVDHTFDRSISIGNILVGLSIQRAVAEGFSVYDFLRGGEEYKFHWSNGGRRTLQLAYYGRKIASLLRLSEKLLKSIAKVLVR
jgi:CelD/BcsL family acetyltransferase involved in cellulose biosynthesis